MYNCQTKKTQEKEMKIIPTTNEKEHIGIKKKRIRINVGNWKRKAQTRQVDKRLEIRC